MTDSVIVDRKFAIVDEWVLNLPISDRALRLYVLLLRYADNHTHKAFPSRETLSKRMACSTSSVDRATQELIDHGAVSKSQRMNSSLVYTVHINQTGSSQVARGVVMGDEGGSSPVQRGVVTGDDLTRTTELEPEELYLQQDVKEAFDQFWQVYPKHLQKGEARKAFFRAANRLGGVAPILDGVARMVVDPNLPPKQFIPYPATWLNREGWDDEPFPERVDLPGVQKGIARSPYVGGPREWVKDMHDMGEHWECKPGEFGCK
jgi:hypothetical protein